MAQDPRALLQKVSCPNLRHSSLLATRRLLAWVSGRESRARSRVRLQPVWRADGEVGECGGPLYTGWCVLSAFWPRTGEWYS